MNDDLISREKLKEHYSWWKDVLDTIINLQQTVEAVEVVRCNDCEHYKPSEADPNRKVCWRKDVDGLPVCYDFYPTDFCSYGERKTKGD